MDWIKTINTHALWKKRLQGLLDGSSDETLDPVAVEVDTICELGQWIRGEGQKHNQVAGFDEMRQMHSEFHRMIGKIVSLCEAGHTESAGSLLNGDFAKLSEQLKHRILSLSNQLR